MIYEYRMIVTGEKKRQVEKCVLVLLYPPQSSVNCPGTEGRPLERESANHMKLGTANYIFLTV